MAHTKAAGKTNQKKNRPGRHLGVKLFGGEKVKIGQIIVKQRGSQFHLGEGVKMGKDFTIFAIRDGLVEFKKRNDDKFISVV